MLRFLLFFLFGIFIFGFAFADSFPRMVSIKAEAVNIRSGPGTKYPKKWVYRQSDLPILVVAEYENWFKFMDWQGDEGWVFKPLTKSKPSFLVTSSVTDLYFDSDEDSQLLARLGKHKSGEVIECVKDFCNIIVKDKGIVYYGWVKEADIWGACTKDDTADCSQ